MPDVKFSEFVEATDNVGFEVVGLQDGDNARITKQILLGYKSYVAIVSQTGTNDPTAIVLVNELGGTTTLNYGSVGSYNFYNTSNPFTADKTVVLVNSVVPDTQTQAYWSNTDLVAFEQQTLAGVAKNGIYGMMVEIRVYL